MIRRFGLVSFFLAAGAYGQPYFNLDFESSARGQIWNWGGCPTQYECVPDTAVFESGVQSLRIRSLAAATTTGFGASSQLLPLTLAQGHHIHISGWIKTDSVSGYAAIWFRVDGASGVLSFDSMTQTGPRGTMDWAQYSLDRDVTPAASDIVLGVILSGSGTAWFDNLEIDIDGVPFDQGPAPATGEPTAAQLGWLTNAAIPLAGVDPGLPLDDLAPLASFIGDAHVVALGEDTHGTSEFFKMKHRIIEYLASQLGFSIFVIEANMPESYAVNDYVLNGNGDPAQLLQGLYFWTWNTQEVLDMIEWMRAFNQSGQGTIMFTGMDMQYGTVAAGIAQSFLSKADPGYSTQSGQVYRDVQLYANGLQDFGDASNSIPAAAAAGKHAHYTAYIKTQNMSNGYAGLWFTVWDANGKTLAFGNTTQAKGTSDWTQYTVDVDVPANAATIGFGALQAGNGTAWFDSPSVTLDGTPYGSLNFTQFLLNDAQGANNFQLWIDPTVTRNGGGPTVCSTYIGPAIPTAASLITETHGVLDYMQSSRDAYLSDGYAAADVDWAIQNANIVAQYADYQSNPNMRDPDMASNAEWILNQAPAGSKMVIWAHNQHVYRYPGAMGSYLAAQYGDDYRVLGFAFHDGQYNAAGTQGLGPYDATPSFPGSAEYVFHSSGLSPFVVDMRPSVLTDPGSGWLRNEIMFRNIGSAPVDGFALTTTLAHDFDALIYIDHSTPSTLLPF